MPRYKLSPEERAQEAECKENLRNIMKGLDVKSERVRKSLTRPKEF